MCACKRPECFYRCMSGLAQNIISNEIPYVLLLQTRSIRYTAFRIASGHRLRGKTAWDIVDFVMPSIDWCVLSHRFSCELLDPTLTCTVPFELYQASIVSLQNSPPFFLSTCFILYTIADVLTGLSFIP